MKLLITILCLLVMCPLWGQYDNILKNKDIVWAAEFEIDFIVDNQDSAYRQDWNRIKTIKLLDVDNPDQSDETDFLSVKILNSAFQDKIKMFEYNNLHQKVNSSILSKRDTVSLCISAMYNETKIFIIKVTAEEIFRYRAKQVIYYNSKKNTFEIQTIAVALTKNYYDDAGNYLGITPIFWIKPTTNNRMDINSKDIIWAKRFTTLKNSLVFDSLKILKNTLPVKIASYFLKAIKDDKIPVYSREDIGYKQLTPIEIESIYPRKDTIVITGYFHELTTQAINYNDVKKLRMVQEWFWDDKKKQLIINLVSVAPLRAVKDDGNYFLFDNPLFYRKTKDD